jgi:hypothetical protein
MFKWLCLGVAAAFLAAACWMLNDIRVQVRRSAATVREAGENINEHLPEIVAKSKSTTALLSKNLPEVVDKVRKTTDTVTESLPEVVERVERTTEVMAELADDIRQLKELAGVGSTKRDENLVAYTNGVLKLIASSGGTIGEKKVVGRGLKNVKPAAEWVAGRRKWALYWMLRVTSKKEMVARICKGAYIELPGKEPVPLIDWVRENHPETKALG